MVRAKVQDYKPEEDQSKAEQVSFSKLISLATPGDKVLFYIGCAFGFGTGVFMPSFVLLMGDAVNALGEPEDP